MTLNPVADNGNGNGNGADSDAEGDALNLTADPVCTLPQRNSGYVEVSRTGNQVTIKYIDEQLSSGSGDFSFTCGYTVSDGDLTDSGTITINVEGTVTAGIKKLLPLREANV